MGMKSHSILQYTGVLPYQTCFFLLAFLCPLPAISNVLVTLDNSMGAFSSKIKLHVSVLSTRECGKEYYEIT